MLTHCLTNYKHMRQPLSTVFYSYRPIRTNEEMTENFFTLEAAGLFWLVRLLFICSIYKPRSHPRDTKAPKQRGAGHQAKTPVCDDELAWRIHRGLPTGQQSVLNWPAVHCSLLLSRALPKRRAEAQPRHAANGDKACLLREIPFRGGQQAPG